MPISLFVLLNLLTETLSNNSKEVHHENKLATTTATMSNKYENKSQNNINETQISSTGKPDR